MELWLIGIGMGRVEHLTLQAVRAINEADLVLIPCKGAEKAELAQLRRRICAEVLTNPQTVLVEFDLPLRDEAADYRVGVDAWHDAIADAWARAIDAHPGAARVALLIWGDPGFYDSSLRIAARLDRQRQAKVRVVPGIMSLQALAAAHAIPLNEIGAPFLVTTGRRLRDEGWPGGIDTVVVMLDGQCSFRGLDPQGIHVWWGAYVGMPDQIVLEGPLAETGPRILAARQDARDRNGWIMDIYLLRRDPAGAPPLSGAAPRP